MGIQSRRNPNVALAQAPARMRDAVGKVLEVGDECVLLTNKMIVRVGEIKPLMDPGAPAGMMVMTLVTRINVVGPRDGGLEDCYFLRHQADIGDNAIAGAGQEPRDRAEGDASDPGLVGGDMTNQGDGEHL
jgi:hypothetical protein